MRLKAKEIYAMYDAITALSKEKTAMPTAFYIAKNTKVIKEEAASIDEARQKIIMDYAEKREDGSVNTQENGMVKINDANLVFFTEQLNSLLDAEIDLPIKKIPLNTLNSINLPIDMIEALIPIIDDSEDNHECCGKCHTQASEPVEVTLNEQGQILEMN